MNSPRGPRPFIQPRGRTREALAGLLAVLMAIAALAMLEPASAQSLASPPLRAVAKPIVTKVSPASGVVTGGTKVTIRGKNFRHVKAVKIGGRRATHIRVLRSTKLTALTPQGFAGRATVVVRTRAGKSKSSRASVFIYKEPASTSRSVVVPKADTVTGTDVAWVSSTDPDGGPAPDSGPWLVGISAGGTVPNVGDGYYLPAGTAAFPSGLAGRVAGVSSQPNGLTAVTVNQEPVSALMDSINSAEIGPGLGTEVSSNGLNAAAGGSPANASPPRMSPGSSSFNFPSMPSSFFACKNSANEAASFGGSLKLSLSNVTHDFAVDKGGLFAKGYVSAWIRTDVTLTGKVSATGKITCKVRADWAKENQKVFVIGEFLVKIKPVASFSVSGTSTLQVTQTTRRMVGFTIFNNHPDTIDIRKNLGLHVDAIDLSAKVEASAGISVKVLYLGTVGIELQVLLAANGKITAKVSPRQACVDLEFGVKFVGGILVDLWFQDWTPVSYSKLFPLIGWHKCTTPINSSPFTNPPTILTTRLPNARVNAPYNAALQTSDNRSGTWAIQASSFPRGLTVDLGSGQISGTPTAGIGDYRFLVTFTDSNGRHTSQNVSLYVGPPMPVGGGDFQATLTWAHYADMDLYVTDPAGETIFYGNKTSASGGQLDRDANAACSEQDASPVENIFWPSAQAPTGTYQVYVNTYSPCGTVSQPWQLVVRVRGVVVLNVSGNGNSVTYDVNVSTSTAQVIGQEPTTYRRTPAK